MSSRSSHLRTFLALTLLVALTACEPASDTMEPDMTDDAQSSAAMMDESAYQDGTYDATGHYTSPAGAEEVDVSVTLKDDVIVSAVFTGKAQNPTSKIMQGRFGDGFEQEVVGKKIDDVSLTVVNGSSLTPKGFMEALATIKAEAKA